MTRWASVFVALLLFSLLWTAGSVAAADRFSRFEIATAAADVSGDQDRISACPKPSAKLQGCCGASFAVPPKHLALDIVPADEQAPAAWCEADASSHDPVGQFRPPIP